MVFNETILSIRQWAFLQAPVQSIAWGVWARQLSLKSSLLVTLLPPTVGGLTVGLFRYLAGVSYAQSMPANLEEDNTVCFRVTSLMESTD